MRVGIGYDVHPLTKGRDLVLGGVSIPFEKGLDGHSDADVLVHAVIDALLGAAGMGDIGRMFPDNDNRYKGISSLLLLRRVGELLKEAMFEIENIDAIIVAQKPKIAPYVQQMKENMAVELDIQTDRINIKATTSEGLGFVGTGDGMIAYAVALLK
ncbi:MAG: 2-C-methyl-D-erythritol 2,4-cyclodiphosphate synthase [Clostridiales bacterium]|jgi:2-C-methyl-D-erythritol 2,4-cyclodiphosphate synthase|nr:2-C-methyl-D-erythritol 2,4-cyclodiphosphate synthase [Clostridiales bacterium]